MNWEILSWFLALLILIGSVYLIIASYIPYMEGKILVIEYDSSFFDAMVGEPGLAVDNDGNLYADGSDTKKGWFGGLIPGEFYLPPFFKVKSDIKLPITEKRAKGTASTGDIILFDHNDYEIVQRIVPTNYLYIRNNYYFCLKGLETANNDYLTVPKLELPKELTDISDDAMQNLAKTIEQLHQMSNALQKKSGDIENLDTELVLSIVIEITNVRDYLYEVKNWFQAADDEIRTVFKDFVASTNYGSLVKLKNATSTLMLKTDENGTETPLVKFLNIEFQRLKLGIKITNLNIIEVQLGSASKEIEDAIKKIQAMKRKVEEEVYNSISEMMQIGVRNLALNKLVAAYEKLMKTSNTTQREKWERIKESHITHYMEAGDQTGGINLPEFAELSTFFNKN